ncbi:protein SCO1/2 [Sphingomonas sp. OV641]|uniref:SCO family protein n=1 Tax=unclassified Sphingomonas TaxID=196159 RepID=UPI000833473A|nr:MULTISPECIES: SCO family protein [unclassified Sphingomonas]SEJ63384.1 protein SCO1/2 [Sphingomonas sp. OV641]
MNVRALAWLVPLALVACSPAQSPARPPLEGARIGGSFTLTDQDGKRLSDSSLAGRYRIMYFGYTFCPDVCPVDVQNLAAALKLLDKSDPELAQRIVPVFVTIDPVRDTPAVLKQFVSAFHPRMIGLTGTQDEISKVAKEFAIFYQRGKGTPDGYLMDHSRQAYLMSPEGKPLALLPQDSAPQAIADEIKRWAE